MGIYMVHIGSLYRAVSEINKGAERACRDDGDILARTEQREEHASRVEPEANASII